MQGLNAEVNKMFGKSLHNYIIASRVAQGKGDLTTATAEEMEDIVLRWNTLHDELKPFFSMKEGRHHLHHGHSFKSKSVDESDAARSENDLPRTGFWHTRHMSFDERKKLHAQKAALKKQSLSGTSTPTSIPARASRAADTGSLYSLASEDPVFEQAIRDSVKETSRGNPEEDVMVEAAIRASIRAMQEKGISIPQPEQVDLPAEKDPSIFKDPEYQVTDEEYQALVEQALQKSMGGQPQEESGDPASQVDDSELKHAIEASMKDAQKHDSQRAEEDIVMEYVKKQSMAEEDYRTKHREGGQGTEGSMKGGDEDEDLRMAMEESLKMSQSSGGGPSGASKG